MAKKWEQLRVLDSTARPAKIIGLFEDEGYNGGFCRDINLYSRLLLVQDLQTGREILVERPRNLWVSNTFDKDGNFVMNHEVRVIVGGCAAQESFDAEDYDENGDATMDNTGTGTTHAPNATVKLNAEGKFCSDREHNFITGEPVEHWFLDGAGNKILPDFTDANTFNKTSIVLGTTTTTTTTTTGSPSAGRVGATRCGYDFGDANGVICVNKPGGGQNLVAGQTYQINFGAQAEGESFCATINAQVDGEFPACDCAGCTYDVVSVTSTGGSEMLYALQHLRLRPIQTSNFMSLRFAMVELQCARRLILRFSEFHRRGIYTRSRAAALPSARRIVLARALGLPAAS